MEACIGLAGCTKVTQGRYVMLKNIFLTIVSWVSPESKFEGLRDLRIRNPKSIPNRLGHCGWMSVLWNHFSTLGMVFLACTIRAFFVFFFYVSFEVAYRTIMLYESWGYEG